MKTFEHAVFLDRDSVGNDIDLCDLTPLARQWTHYGTTSPQQALERLSQAQLVITNKVMLDRSLLANCPNLALICVAATGTNNVDLAAAQEFGITVCNVTAYGTASVAQQVFSLLLALTTRLDEHLVAARDGRWQRSPHFCVLDLPFRELSGKTFGIIGYGELGRGVAKIAAAFGMHILIAQRPGREVQAGRVSLDTLLKEADVVSLHVPLADNTRDLINAERLALMKPDAILINTARGGIVDESALLEALQQGRLGGAGFDVLGTEPPQAGNPLLASDLPNLLVTPHIAWAARESRQRLMRQVVANIQAYCAGNPINEVRSQ